jgi:tetratricopeptide (TPR) repeat protein
LNAYCYYNRGISYDKKGNSEEAVKNFTKAIEIDKTKADFYSNRGFAYRKLKRYEEAIKDYTEAISLNPSTSISM